MTVTKDTFLSPAFNTRTDLNICLHIKTRFLFIMIHHGHISILLQRQITYVAFKTDICLFICIFRDDATVRKPGGRAKTIL